MVIVNTNRLKWEKAVSVACDEAAYALAEQILSDSTKYVPYSAGSVQSAGGLRDSGRVEKGKSGAYYVIWDTVYALYQWFGMRADGTHKVTHYTTPGTGKQWVEAAKATHELRWQKVAQSSFTKGLK